MNNEELLLEPRISFPSSLLPYFSTLEQPEKNLLKTKNYKLQTDYRVQKKSAGN
jgi:hypothetical protein